MRILIPILIFSLSFSQEYCAGDVISAEHQNQGFDVCYPCDTCDTWSLSQYAGDILFLDMSASWCAPCFSAIDFIDQLEEYWGEQNPNVKFVTALADIGEPFSCEQWGIQGTPGSPLIVEDDGKLFDWFHDSNGQYPSYVLIDHEMRVRVKPSNMLSNGNNNSCDGEGVEGDCLNSLITSLLDECGEGCSSSICSDNSACNSGDNTDCIYPDANYDCCGVCTAEVDCLGVCGGSATDQECSDSTNNCPTCTIVCPPDDVDCDGDFTNIQDAIEFTAEGDTILVEQGIYYENIVIQKNITLASRAIFDDMSDWVGYSDAYFVNNENINSTILNGSADTNGEGFESVLLIESLNDCIEPLIFGFTITGGEGTRVMVEVEGGGEGGREEVEQIRGGGFLAVNALPRFKHNAIIQNKGDDESIHSGGGGDQTSGVDIPTHPDFNWDSPRTECDGELDLSFNLYKDNDATYGNTFSTLDFEGSVDMSSSIFDVYNCDDDEVTTVWVDVEEEVEVDFSYGVGDLCSITDDVWVSPDGDDDNLGTSESQAFLTIGRALEMIAPEDDDPVTINLTEGTFSPSTTGETFSILMISNVNIIGQGEEVTIIDAEQTDMSAEQTDRVMLFEFVVNTLISDLTIKGGFASDTSIGSGSWDAGGGMYFWYSNPTLSNVTITDNWSGAGSGLLLLYSNATLSNVTITNNMSLGCCAGMYVENSNPTLSNVTITDNWSDWDSGGMYLGYSNPTLSNVTITNNVAYGRGGGMNIFNSNPTLSNVTITNNSTYGPYSEGGGMYLGYSNPTLSNVTITNNVAGGGNHDGGGIKSSNSNLVLVNTILWGNSPQEIDFYQSDDDPHSITIAYSDIQGGLEAIETNGNGNVNWLEGNIDADPLFVDPENTDYTLQAGSPCIDSGDPNLWYQDVDGTRSDMGVTGGLYVLPNFSSFDFGDVGDIGSDKQFTLYNYRETPITISEVNFNTSSFSTNTSFPITIEPLQTRIINIETNNSSFEFVQDEMELVSEELPDGISVSLSVTGTGGNVLTGNLSGTYPIATYRISGDLTIASADTVILEAGTEFQFDGEYNFNIYGILKAVGTEEDSIIFDNFGEERWRGFILDGASDETEFQYVRISGAEKDDGGGMYLYSSNPTLTNVTISENIASSGGGLYLEISQPTLNNVTIANNTAVYNGGGMHLHYSHPTLTHVTISGNTANYASGMWLENSNPTLTNVTISGNTAIFNGGMRLSNSNPILTNVTIANNTANYGAGGMHLGSSHPTLTNVTIANNTGGREGGGMRLSNSNPILTNVTIANNTADEHGGGLYLSYTSDPTLTNVTISGNTAGFSGGGMYLHTSDPTLTNSIIWDNSPESIYIDDNYSNLPPSTPTIIYSDIEGGWEGEGNIYLDPFFTDPENGYFTLQEGSPCIDAGTAYLEYEGEVIVDISESEYFGFAPDMGAFESPYSTDCDDLLGDINADGSINVLDVVALVENILSAGEYNPAGDLEEDGVLNVLDIVALVNLILGGGE